MPFKVEKVAEFKKLMDMLKYIAYYSNLSEEERSRTNFIPRKDTEYLALTKIDELSYLLVQDVEADSETAQKICDSLFQGTDYNATVWNNGNITIYRITYER